MKINQRVCYLSTLAGMLMGTVAVKASPISLPAVGYEYFENFNSLANSGTSSVLPSGWAFAELGSSADGTYAADNGSSSIGNTYSYGNDGLSERGFGSLNSGQFEVTFGAQFQNNTGEPITLDISYRGEVWRLGTTNLLDRLDFQFSTDATSLTSGTWTDFNPLDFSDAFLTPLAPAVGQYSGNSDPYNSLISSPLSGLSVANEAVFWLRWYDFDVLGGPDDGLAIDQFRLTATPQPPALPEPAAFWLAFVALPAILFARRRGQIA
jgi:hypothetical protein